MAVSAAAMWMITGGRLAGKTTFCRDVAESARQAGWDVAGLLSPARIEQGIKTGILAEDLRTRETHLLASDVRRRRDDLLLGKWYFDRQTLAWGNSILADSLPCNLLVVDELGPLELIRRLGWQAALEILPRPQYCLALVVIRPELQAAAHRLFVFSKTVEIDPTHTNVCLPQVKMDLPFPMS